MILNVFLSIIDYKNGGLSYSAMLFPLELLVFIIEATAFSILLNRKEEIKIRKRRLVSYALVANLASLIIGLLVNGLF